MEHFGIEDKIGGQMKNRPIFFSFIHSYVFPFARLGIVYDKKIPKSPLKTRKIYCVFVEKIQIIIFFTYITIT